MWKVWKNYYISVELSKSGNAGKEVDAQADTLAQRVSRELGDADESLVGTIIQAFRGGREVSRRWPAVYQPHALR